MTTEIGNLGEQLVSQWLQSKSYSILHHSWRCRYGEIDIIARSKNSSTLVFVEVKTRGSYNWDHDGLEAISPLKQQKISRSATLFLAQNTQYTDYYMRFDVALVKYKQHRDGQLEIPFEFRSQKKLDNHLSPERLVSITKGFQFTIVNYIENAFDTV